MVLHKKKFDCSTNFLPFNSLIVKSFSKTTLKLKKTKKVLFGYLANAVS